MVKLSPVSVAAMTFTLISMVCANATAEDWQDAEMIGRNKEPGHCTLLPFANQASALGGRHDTSQSRWVLPNDLYCSAAVG